MVQRIDPVDPETPKDFAGLKNCFDTVLCVNVLEYVDNPKRVLERLGTTLKPAGILLILVPQNSQLYGSADRRLGHTQRFSKAEIREMLHSQGLAVEKISDFNKAGTPPVVGLQQTLWRTEDQQTIVEDFRQNCLGMAPA
jgi:SAM-dependent methyltransferase